MHKPNKCISTKLFMSRKQTVPTIYPLAQKGIHLESADVFDRKEHLHFENGNMVFKGYFILSAEIIRRICYYSPR